jgi:hypothetical protein
MRLSLPSGIRFLAFFVCSCFPVFSQTTNKTAASPGSSGSDSPLALKIVPAEQADYDSCAQAGSLGKMNLVGLEMQNSGEKPLRGYVVAVWYHDNGSRFVTHQTVYKLIRPGEPTIAPGSHWHTTACGLSKNADLDDPKAQVDLLMYDDGSTWGPVELVQSNRLDGELIGMNFVAGGDNRERGYDTATPLDAGPTGAVIPGGELSFFLEISGVVEHDSTGQALLDVQATNKGIVPVIGYEYSINFFDHATGNSIKRVGTKALETHRRPTDYLQPGATWVSGGRKVPTSSDGELATYTVDVDVVIFADGTVAGPCNSRQADELIGMVEGMGELTLAPTPGH